MSNRIDTIESYSYEIKLNCVIIYRCSRFVYSVWDFEYEQYEITQALEWNNSKLQMQ